MIPADLGPAIRVDVPPFLADRCDRVLGTVHRRPHGCAHLDEDGVACVQHPERGVMCSDCWDRHRLTHTGEAEHTCDRCGQSLYGDDGETPYMVAVGVTESNVLVSIGRGRKVIVRKVTYFGWGWCLACDVERGLEAIGIA